MNFDHPIDRHGMHSLKWDEMEKWCGVPADKGLAMWVADMDFAPPESVRAVLERMTAHGVFGYFGDYREYLESIRWWMHTRHGWEVEPEHILTTHGVVNAVGICLEAYTAPGDGVVLLTPVYHAFARVIKAAGRTVVECPLEERDGRLVMPLERWAAQMTGKERLLILCSPHNPGGRVWTLEELQGIAEFCQQHDLILVSDEIHHDLVFPGYKHIVTETAAPHISDRLVTLTSTTKTFNLASIHTGNAIIRDSQLRARFNARLAALGLSPNGFAGHIVPAAYSPEGVEWLEQLIAYLDGNRQLFDDAINSIPGVQSMRLEATYLAWVDFRGTELPQAEVQRRITKLAQIATNAGPSFGTGGDYYVRFNIGTQRTHIEQAIARLRKAFR